MSLPAFFSDLQKDELRAQAFIESTCGTVLHEVAHFCAANERRPIAGHLIFAIDQTRAGAFMPAPAERATWSKKDRQFTIAAAVLAEMHFCGGTYPSRALADLNSYQEVTALGDRSQVELRDQVMQWKSSFGQRVAALEERINATYDACREAVESGHFRIGGYHVVPSSRLPAAFASVDFADHHSRVAAAFSARWFALGEFLEELNRPGLNSVDWLKARLRTSLRFRDR